MAFSYNVRKYASKSGFGTGCANVCTVQLIVISKNVIYNINFFFNSQINCYIMLQSYTFFL